MPVNLSPDTTPVYGDDERAVRASGIDRLYENLFPVQHDVRARSGLRRALRRGQHELHRDRVAVVRLHAR